GSPDGILIFDPSAFAKKGNASVGVQRQWCGRLGKIDNCQVGVYLAYVGRSEHALVDVRLYLPKEWAKDKKRRAEAGVPETVRFQTRHELALEMLDEHGQLLPHAWIGGDDEMGRCSWFRQELSSRGERYLLAVPSNTKVRDLKAADPEPTGRGHRPRAAFVRVDDWRAAAAEGAGPAHAGAGRGERARGGAGSLDAGAGAQRGPGVGCRGGAGGLPGAARRRGVETRLPAEQCGVRSVAGGVRAGVQGRASGGRVLAEGQRRG